MLHFFMESEDLYESYNRDPDLSLVSGPPIPVRLTL